MRSLHCMHFMATKLQILANTNDPNLSQLKYLILKRARLRWKITTSCPPYFSTWKLLLKKNQKKCNICSNYTSSHQGLLGSIAKKVKMERKSQHVALDNSFQSLIEKGLERNSGNETLTKQTLKNRFYNLL